MTKRILIVEDQEDNRQIMQDLLESAGYEVIIAVNGHEGVAKAQSDNPDLVLMDIQLPDISGLEVTRWLKDDETLKTIPMVAITAFAMKGDKERFMEVGCEAYIAKPILSLLPSDRRTLRELIHAPKAACG